MENQNEDQKVSEVVSDDSQPLQSSQMSKHSSPEEFSVKSQNEPKIQEDVMVNQQEQRRQRREPQGRSVSSFRNDDQMSVQVKREKQEDITMGQQIVDLNRYIFNGLVQLCLKERIMSPELGHHFLNKHTVGIDKKFIELYRENRLQQFDFQKCKINLFDHRKLAEMLVEHNPDKYLPLKQPYDFNKDTQELLREIYQMTEVDYKREWEEQVNRYGQYWWGGPRKLDPVCDPPVKFYQTEEGRVIRQQRAEAIRIETIEEEKQRNKRVREQRTVSQDIKEIGALMMMKKYGNRIKIEADSQGQSKNGDASAGDESKSKKQKKIKKEKKDKSHKKEKKKDKKHKKEKHSKDKKGDQPKKEPESNADALSKAQKKK